MSAVIRLLSPDLVAKIAAGEVVERPTSVVKELVENALDARATSIRVEIQRGGFSLIRVTDNGSGIAPDQLELAVCRHATSKLTAFDDLYRVQTLGFRGEALASIAAVAHLEMISRPLDQKAGHAIKLEGGRVTGQGPAGCPAGTTATVRQLFFNVPARQGFQRSPGGEARQIVQLCGQLALASPQTRLVLEVDGHVALQAPGTGALDEALVAVYGPTTAGRMLALPPREEDGVRVSGYCSAPAEHRNTRLYCTFTINGRVVRSQMLTYALEEAYHALLPAGRHPVAAVQLTVPPDEVDVNVHPTKMEVRLQRDRLVFSLLRHATRAALAEFAPVPMLQPSAIDGTTWMVSPPAAEATNGPAPAAWPGAPGTAGMHPGAPENPADGASGSLTNEDTPGTRDSGSSMGGGAPGAGASESAVAGGASGTGADGSQMAGSEPGLGANAVTARAGLPSEWPAGDRGAALPAALATAGAGGATLSGASGSGVGSTMAQLVAAMPPPPRAADQAAATPPSGPGSAARSRGGAGRSGHLRALGQVGLTYIVAEDATGLYLIDQHSAHERIVYEQLQQAVRTAGDVVAAQLLLSPEVVELAPTQAAWLASSAGALERFGYQLEPFGGRTWLLRAVPRQIAARGRARGLGDLIDGLLDHEYGDGPVHDQAMWAVACHSAVRAGDALSPEEMAALIAELERCDMRRTCPHGRPTMIHLSHTQLAREFGRR